jgi:hypothetical protein
MSEVNKGGARPVIPNGNTTNITKNAQVYYDKRRHHVLAMFENQHFENVSTAVHRLSAHKSNDAIVILNELHREGKEWCKKEKYGGN